MSDKLCDLCDDSTTAVVCCQLEDLFLCVKHQKIHLERSRTKEHVLETFSERDVRLQTERSEEYNQQLSKLSNSLKVDLSNQGDFLLHAEALKIHEQLEAALLKTKEDILHDFQNIRDSFSNRHKKLIEEFESIYVRKKGILKSQIQEADRLLGKLQSFKDVTLEVISTSSQTPTMKKMVDARKAAQACIAEVVLAKAEIYPKTHPDLFFARDDSILDQMKKIGQLETREAAAIKCVASGSGLSSVNATTGEGKFTITLFDRDGIPCLLIPNDLELTFLMENKEESDAKVEIKSAKRGSVDVIYKVTLNKCSSFLISVKIKGVHVCGSPFTVVSKVEIEGKYIKHFGGNGSADGLFSNPWGVAAYQGEIFITDYGNNRIQVFDADGKFLRKFGGSGNGDGLFRNPEGICVFYGEIFVCDYNGHQIQVFSTDGRFLRRWGSVGSGEGQLSGPIGVSVSEFGFVYVAESGNHRISVFTSDGIFMNHIGTSGSGPGNLSNPWNVTVDKEELFVTEYGNCRISVFALDGTFLRTFGTRGAGDGNLQSPEDCLVYSDLCYVCDFGNNRISVFSRDGKFVRKFGSHGSGEGQFMGPLSMAVLDGRAYVAEYYAPQRIIILE